MKTLEFSLLKLVCPAAEPHPEQSGNACAAAERCSAVEWGSDRAGVGPRSLAGEEGEEEGGPIILRPAMEEPRKVLSALYLGSVPVAAAAGMDLLNGAIDALLDRVPRAHWLPVQVGRLSSPFLGSQCQLRRRHAVEPRFFDDPLFKTDPRKLPR